MAWYCSYLPKFKASLFNWSVLVLLGFEIVYIAIQSVRGQLSHFNQTTTLYTLLYALMAIAATSVTISPLTSAYYFVFTPSLIYRITIFGVFV